jgi:hypothetical protein
MSTGAITLSPGDGFTRPGSFVDPGTDTFTMTVNYGEGSPVVTYPSTPAGVASPYSLGHVYTTSGSYTVTVTIADDDGGTTTKTFTVKVGTPPKVTTVTDKTVGKNVALPLAFAFTGTANTNYNYSINWGDPSGTNNTQAGSAGSTDGSGNGSTPSLSHTYKHKGIYTVYVTITDPITLESNTISFKVTVN